MTRSGVTVTEEPDAYDVFVQGTVFYDIVMTGLQTAPTTGTEIFAEGMGSCPGGVANFDRGRPARPQERPGRGLR